MKTKELCPLLEWIKTDDVTTVIRLLENNEVKDLDTYFDYFLLKEMFHITLK